jgi:hypothetical protein
MIARTDIRPLTAEIKNGAVAQLGERMNGIHEVRGSIPLGSTNIYNELGRPLGRPKSLVCL